MLLGVSPISWPPGWLDVLGTSIKFIAWLIDHSLGKGGGALQYKKEGSACQKFWKEPLRGVYPDPVLWA